MDLDPKLLKELTQIFQTELDEQLQVITDGLLFLEKNTEKNETSLKTIEAIFRAAHNIKGAARGIGVDNVGEIAHHIESLFTSVKQDEITIGSHIIDLCLEAVDCMRSAMLSFTDNKPLSFDLEELVRHLKTGGALKKIKADQIETKKISPDKVKSHAKTTEHETIRVSIDHLEQVSAIVEEIQVNKIAIDEYFTELTKLNAKMQEISHLWKQEKYSLSDQYGKDANNNIQKLYNLNTDNLNDIGTSIHNLHKNMRPRINELSNLSNSLQTEVRMLRLVPASELLRTFPRNIRDLAKELGKDVELTIHGDEVKMDKMVLEGLKDPLMHILRNAVDHGIENPALRKEMGKPMIGRITITITEEGNQIFIVIKDDGVGIDSKKIATIAESKNIIAKSELETMNENEILELILRPGFSTKEKVTEVSGRGVGLDVVKQNMEHLKGSVSIQTELGRGTTFIMRVPLTLASEHGLMVSCADQLFALPLSSIERVLDLHSNNIVEVSSTQAILLDKHPVPLRSLADILAIKQLQPTNPDRLAVVVVKKGWNVVALLVDEIIGEREIVVKPLRPPLLNVSCVAGGTLSGNGHVIVVLDTTDLINIALHLKNTNRVTQQGDAKLTAPKLHILIVDDSITTRTMEKNILESKNYEVTVAVNGKEAWDILQKQRFSLLITDITMPIMDGFTLTEKVKASKELRDMPVIIVTSLDSDAEKKRGIDAGANAYIVKNEFESGTLLEIVSQLV